MKCNKRNCNTHYAIFRVSNFFKKVNMLYCNPTFSRTFAVDLLSDLLSVFGPIIFLHCWQIFQNEMSHFFENGSPTLHYIDTLP